ncbi:MAG: hypothetical protein JRG96_03155 [Deltaproteobacteria bacterium]|nr:hypothetical protein [Deltaproteobacteria bacterium]MBW2417136.1 hypothetical protein [Deltaproteobacteria bacterium]
MSQTQIPRLDFARIPDELQGLWVVVRVGKKQKVIGQGRTAEEALSASGVSVDDKTAVLTQVPTEMPVAYMGQVEPA